MREVEVQRQFLAMAKALGDAMRSLSTFAEMMHLSIYALAPFYLRRNRLQRSYSDTRWKGPYSELVRLREYKVDVRSISKN